MKDQTKQRIQTMALWAVSSAALLCANLPAEANVAKRKSFAHPVVTEKYKPVLLRYAGQGNWSLPRLAANVKGFYLKEYGHQPASQPLAKLLRMTVLASIIKMRWILVSILTAWKELR